MEEYVHRNLMPGQVNNRQNTVNPPPKENNYKNLLPPTLPNKSPLLNDGKSTPLHHAVLDQNIEKVKKLVDEGADLKAEDENGRTPFQLARHILSLTISPNVNYNISRNIDTKRNTILQILLTATYFKKGGRRRTRRSKQSKPRRRHSRKN